MTSASLGAGAVSAPSPLAMGTNQVPLATQVRQQMQAQQQALAPHLLPLMQQRQMIMQSHLPMQPRHQAVQVNYSTSFMTPDECWQVGRQQQLNRDLKPQIRSDIDEKLLDVSIIDKDALPQFGPDDHDLDIDESPSIFTSEQRKTHARLERRFKLIEQ